MHKLWGLSFFPKCSKFDVDYTNGAKNWERDFCFLMQNSNIQDGVPNYFCSLIENTNEKNIQRRIWEATEKPTKSHHWECWYHHERNKERSEWYKWAKSKSRAYRDSAGIESC